MIHQFIFAAPKPGMSEAAFQDYWLNNHAVNFASKIPQIKKYKLDLRVPTEIDEGDPLYGGIAEIWLNNDEEQIASLQTPEFLQGARLDEPNWAAFWKTLVLDTELAFDSMSDHGITPKPGIKAIIISKRKNGLELDAFRTMVMDSHLVHLKGIPNLKRVTINFVRDSWYFLGEPSFDMIITMWFDGIPAMVEALRSKPYKNCTNNEAGIVNSKYRFSFFVDEHWIIGPEFRR